jgi:manganese/zinc/iron transport system permease protein
MLLVACVTVIGLQSVGLLLVVAMLIIPAAAARFWTDRLESMTLAAALIGGLSASGGVLVSALFPRLAAGAVIVLMGTFCFVVSMLAGRRHGIVRRAWLHWRMTSEIDRQHLLRAMYEQLEAKAGSALPRDVPAGQVSFDELLSERSWTRRRLRELLAQGERAGAIRGAPERMYSLTHEGFDAARRVARNHRLWELYLMTYADVAPTRVDRYADMIEHILEPEILAELDRTLARKYPHLAAMPHSPHVIGQPAS